jgi:glycosyltransferase involved in cell wall biosynthesis
MPDETPDFPLVSVVTATLNMGRFLEETIRSVLEQDYPNVEHIVVDGGSNDSTRDILRRYEGRIRYVSEPDNGQADAINKGFRMSRGRIFAFLNADDTYLPGAISAAVRALLENPGVAVVYGEAYYVAEDGSVITRYPTQPFAADLLSTQCYVCQPAAFIRREVFDAVGMLNAELHYALDYDLWMRIAKVRPMLKIDQYLATSRMYRENKTVRLRRLGLAEILRISRRHRNYVPPNWVYGYCCSVLDKRDGFFEPYPTSVTKCAATLAYGSCLNLTSLFRYWRDCAELFGPAVRSLIRRQPVTKL